MNRLLALATLCVLNIISTVLYSKDTHWQTSSGFSGYIYTPSAYKINDTSWQMSASNTIDPHLGDVSKQLNFNLLIGLFPRIELGGRIAEVEASSGDRLVRDLSFNVKGKVLPEGHYFPAISLGIQDLGGALEVFGARYVVASKSWRILEGSLGYGIGPDRLNGMFGGLKINILPNIRTFKVFSIVDYDSEKISANLRTSTQKINWQNTDYQFDLDLIASNIIARTDEFNIGPRFGVSGTIAWENAPRSLRIDSAINSVLQANFHSVPNNQYPVQCIERRLKEEGMRDVEITHDTNQLPTIFHVEYENGRYLTNEMFGLRFVVNSIFHCLSFEKYAEESANVFITIKKNQLSRINFRFSLNDLRRFKSGELIEEDFKTKVRIFPVSHVVWRLPEFRSDIVLRPEFSTKVATEETIFGFQADLAPELFIPTHPGGVWAAKVNFPLNDGGSFTKRDKSPYLSRVVLHQAFNLKVLEESMFQFTLGMMEEDNWGILGEYMMPLIDDILFSKIVGGATFGNTFDTITHWTVLGELYAKVETQRPNHALFAQFDGGRFYSDDYGARFSIGRYFNSSRFSLFLSGNHNEQFHAGAFLELPLTTEREIVDSNYIRFRLPERFAYSQKTTMFETKNVLRSNVTVPLRTGYDISTIYFDRYRLTPEMILKHISWLK